MLFHTYKDVEVEMSQTAERTLNQHTAFLPIQLDGKAKCKKIRIRRGSRKGISLPNITPLTKLMSKCRFYVFTLKNPQKGRIKWPRHRRRRSALNSFTKRLMKTYFLSRQVTVHVTRGHCQLLWADDDLILLLNNEPLEQLQDKLCL